MKVLFLLALLLAAPESETVEGRYIGAAYETQEAVQFRVDGVSHDTYGWHMSTTRYFLDGREVRRHELPAGCRVRVVRDKHWQLVEVRGYR